MSEDESELVVGGKALPVIRREAGYQYLDGAGEGMGGAHVHGDYY